MLFRSRRVCALALIALSAAACGGPPPAPPAVAAAPRAAAPKAPAFDLSPVPEPAGLILVGRVNKPDAIVQTAGSWVHLPLPTGADLVRSVTDDSVAEIVDLSQPIDLAVTLELTMNGVLPDVSSLAAFSVAVKNYEQAKTKLAEHHELATGPDGLVKIDGFFKAPSKPRSKRRRETRSDGGRGGRGSASESPDHEERSERSDGCVLAPAQTGARLVCGEDDALTALAPYLSRTMPRQTWTSDVHLEVRPDTVRGPLKIGASGIGKSLASLIGGGSAGALLEASLGEIVDFVDDTQRIALDVQAAESGVTLDMRLDFQSNKSLMARATTARGGETPPAAFWHLPPETDMAMFGRGSDPKLFDHPRELIGNVIVEYAGAAGVAEADSGLLKDLVADRFFKLFTNGPGLYAKGFDEAAMLKARDAYKAIKSDQRAAREDAKRVVEEKLFGWHLVQVSEPVAQVGPMLKDWSALWNRPSFSKWLKGKGPDNLPSFRITPAPAGVTLPKETIHLEVTIPRDDVPSSSDGIFDPTARTPGSANKKTPPIKLKPSVMHVFAVPDAGATWLAFGFDTKLVAQKAAAALSSAPSANTLGKANGLEVLREGKVSSGAFFTLRSFLGLGSVAITHDAKSWTIGENLPHKGLTPILFTARSAPPSSTASAGSSVGTFRLPRAVIEDIVQAVLQAR